MQNLDSIAASVPDGHQNFVLEEINSHCLRMAVMEETTFPWHSHPDSDELFMILQGNLVIEFQTGESVSLQSGDFFKVAAGRIHRTTAIGRTVHLCFESTLAETKFL